MLLYVRVKETHEPHQRLQEPCNGAPEKKVAVLSPDKPVLAFPKAQRRPRNLSRNLDLLASISQLPHEACAPLPAAVLQTTWGFAIEHRCPHLRRRNSHALPFSSQKGDGAWLRGSQYAPYKYIHNCAVVVTVFAVAHGRRRPWTYTSTGLWDYHRKGFAA